MRFPATLSLAFLFVLGALCSRPTVHAQSPQQLLRKQQQMQKEMQKKMREIAESQPELPSDPQLLNLQKEFIVKTEKLALEFERKKQFNQAREAYESIVRLVPKYARAEEGLNRVLGGQLTQDRKLLAVSANKEWQDSGIVLQADMPVRVEVNGTWKVVYETGPKGIEIPNEMKPRDGRIRLGTLIGAIVASPSELAEAKHIPLEGGQQFVAKQSGRLFLRMFDVDPSDNEGKLMVMIQSSFGK